MEIRLIDGTPFIVTSHGKRESLFSPAEARIAEQKEIDEGKAHICQLDRAVAIIRQRIEAELLDAIDTSASRQELAALDEEVHSIQRDVDTASKRLKNIDVMIDQHAAAAIQIAADARLAALIQPFDTIIKELAK